MFKRYGYCFAIAVLLLDLVWVVCAWGLSFEFRFYGGLVSQFAVIHQLPDIRPYLDTSLPLVFIFGAVFVNRGFYRTSRTLSLDQELKQVVKGCILAFAFFLAFLYATHPPGGASFINQVFLGVFLVTVVPGLLILRSLQRIVIEALHSCGYYTRRTLLIGDGETAPTVYRRLSANRGLGLEFVGLVTRTGQPGPEDLPEAVGSYDDLERVIREKGVAQAIVALPAEDRACLDPILQRLVIELVDVRVVPDLFKYDLIQQSNTSIEGLPVVSLNEPRLNSRALVLKRVLDLSLSGLALILFAPVMLLVAIAVKLTSRGPVFYVQERMGLDGRRFRILKFRTMPAGVEDQTGPVWSSAEDPRPTPLGRFLRRTALDELPQLLNVLVGQMSLVGPRPERPFFVEDFRKKLPGYVFRHKVKGGITGWAQINGWRGNTSLEKRLDHDRYYIRNWSLAFDLKILLLTIRYCFYRPPAT